LSQWLRVARDVLTAGARSPQIYAYGIRVMRFDLNRHVVSLSQGAICQIRRVE